MAAGEKIKRYRKSLGITRNELAERSGIHPVTIRKYETNKLVPKIEQIVKKSQMFLAYCLVCFFEFKCKFRKT